MDTLKVIMIIAIVVNTGLGIFILSRQPTSWTQRLFALVAFTGVLWSIANHLSVTQDNSATTLVFARLEMVCASFYSMSSFLLVFNYPNTDFRLSQKKLEILLLITTAILSLTLTPFIFQSVEGFGTNVNVKPGPGIALFGLFNATLILWSMGITLKRGRRKGKVMKWHYYYLFVGILVSNFSGFITNFVLVNILRYTYLLPAAPIFTIIFAIVMSYAIVTREMFDVRLFISKATILTLVFGILFSLYGFFIYIFTSLIGAEKSINGSSLVISLISISLISFTFEPLRRWLQGYTDSFLYRKEYEQNDVIQNLASKLTEVITLPEAMKTVMQELSNTLHLKYATAYILQLGAHNIYSIHQIVLFGNISAHKASLQQDDLVIQYFVHHPSIETIEALNRSVQVEKKLLEKANLESNNPSSADILIREHALKHAVITKFNELGVRAAIPIHINNQLASLILLGNRLSGDRLNSNDLNLLEGVRSQAVIAIQKAKLYEGDQMKSEFVSVASHELLTPIAAMEGYLNMIMSDRYDGQIDEQAKDYISKVYSSTHRLGNLVKDLLSVSRIESGAMSFNIQSVNVDSIIQDAVDQLEITAKNKGLSLAYLRTKNPVPNILVDSERTTQILINLIGNAVKYTPSGSVTITTSVDNHKKFVWIHVTDTGLGISKKDQEHLFQKFYRVDTPDRTGIVGTGLGLYLIKSMAEKMGGEIAVKSSVGEGSTFSCGLPYTLATHTEN